MKLLVIDNQTNFLPQIEALCDEHDHDVIGASDILKTSIESYDAVILTGSYRYAAISDHFAAERALILKAERPVIGICLGFQLIVAAYGGKLIREEERAMKRKEIWPTPAGASIFGEHRSLIVGAAHRWYAREVPPELTVLATSATGIEAVIHHSKPIIGFQFHPESAISGAIGRGIFHRALSMLTENRTRS